MKLKWISIFVLVAILITGCQWTPDVQRIESDSKYGEVLSFNCNDKEWYVVYRIESDMEKKDAFYLERHGVDGEKNVREILPMSEENVYRQQIFVTSDFDVYAFEWQDGKYQRIVLMKDGAAQTVVDSLDVEKEGITHTADRFWVSNEKHIVLCYSELKLLLLLDENGNKIAEKEYDANCEMQGISALNGKLYMKNKGENQGVEVSMENLENTATFEINEEAANKTSADDYFFVGKEKPVYIVTQGQVYDIKTGEPLLGSFYEGTINESMGLKAGGIMGNQFMLLYRTGYDDCASEKREGMMSLEDDCILTCE